MCLFLAVRHLYSWWPWIEACNNEAACVTLMFRSHMICMRQETSIQVGVVLILWQRKFMSPLFSLKKKPKQT